MDTTSGVPEVTQQPPVTAKMECVWFHQASRKPVSVPVPEGGTMIMQDVVQLALVQLGLEVSVADVTVKFGGKKLAPDALISQYQTSETKPLWLEVTEPKAGPSSSKRRKLTVSDQLRRFYNALKMARIRNDILQLPNGMKFLNSKNLPSELYVRKAYEDLHSLIHDAYPQDNILVVGNPGTGKSFFALYEMYRLLDKATIVYESVPFDLFMVLSADNITYAGDRLSNWDPEIEKLLGKPGTYYLFDAGAKRGVYPYIVYAKTIVFSAPNWLNYADYSKHARPRILYMPVWTLDELDQVWNNSDEELQARYNIWGGIPRYILDSNQSTVAIDRGIEIMSPDQLRKLAQKLYQFDTDEELSHKILHIHVSRDEAGKPNYERRDIFFASDYVKDKVFLRLERYNSVPPILRM